MQRDESLGVAATDADDRESAVYCSQHQPMPGIRDVSSVRGEPFDDKTGERCRFEHVADHRDEVHLGLRIAGAVLVPVVGILSDCDLWDRRAEQLCVWALDRHSHGFDARALLTHWAILGRVVGDIYLWSPIVPRGR